MLLNRPVFLSEVEKAAQGSQRFDELSNAAVMAHTSGPGRAIRVQAESL